MNPPTAAEFRADTRINWVTLGYPTSPAGDALLEEEIALSWAYVEEKTCRDLDALDANSNLGRLASRALKYRTIQSSTQSEQSAIIVTTDSNIRSFSVPGYSETRFSPSELYGDADFDFTRLNPLPSLAELLWLMMTEECKAAFLVNGGSSDSQNAPYSQITAVGWYDCRGHWWD